MNWVKNIFVAHNLINRASVKYRVRKHIDEHFSGSYYLRGWHNRSKEPLRRAWFNSKLFK